MNKINAFILILVCITSTALADVYVVTNSKGAVYSISNQNDAVIPQGYNLTVMKGQNIRNLPITGNPRLYNFSNGSFTLNPDAVISDQALQAKNIAEQQAKVAAKISAIEKLTDAISKVDVNDVLTNTEMQALLPS